jgi:transcriptional regulator with XRE-family HTH domain
MDVGKEIRRLREANGWSQAKLAGDAGMGISGISQIETGTRNPSAVTLSKIASALGVEVADLFPKEQPRLPELVPPGEAYFVPLEEGEEDDTVTLQLYYVRLLEGGEPILKAMRIASPAEAAKIRQEFEKAGRESA